MSFTINKFSKKYLSYKPKSVFVCVHNNLNLWNNYNIIEFTVHDIIQKIKNRKKKNYATIAKIYV